MSRRQHTPNKQCALNNNVRLITRFYGRSKECVSLAVQLQFVCRWLLTGGTVIPVSLIAVVPTVLEKIVFYGYLTVASVSLGLPTQFVHCCLVTARAFMPATLTVIC